MKRPLAKLLAPTLVALIALTISAGAQPPTPPKSPMPASAMAGKTDSAFAARKAELMRSKKVGQWPGRGSLGTGGPLVVALTVSECAYLGGSVVYHSSCGGTSLKCVAPNGHEMCIDTIK